MIKKFMKIIHDNCVILYCTDKNNEKYDFGMVFFKRVSDNIEILDDFNLNKEKINLFIDKLEFDVDYDFEILKNL